MNKKFYTTERAPQILISLLKAHGISDIVASPGTTNMAFIGSAQNDPFFKIYSSVDERSAAYIACGIAAQTGKPVVLSCTGATASRNYLPGLTEAYYRKLPVLAVTSTNGIETSGHLVPQNIDRHISPIDTTVFKTHITVVHDLMSEWLANTNINKAILALTHRGGGPAHINLETAYTNDFSAKNIPDERVIQIIGLGNSFPSLPEGAKVAVFIGAHKTMSRSLVQAIDSFCATNDAVVICDHTSSYHGRYRVQSSLIAAQPGHKTLRDIDIMVHIGEVSGDYYSMGIFPKRVWRVSEDGEVRDRYHLLSYVFEMPEIKFFTYYSSEDGICHTQLEACIQEADQIIGLIPELPFSHIWLARYASSLIPSGAIVHFGILNSLRSWNFFLLPESVETFCNVGGFGIDGILSTLIGASLAAPGCICFAILGDLAFFYDLNSLANRHVGANVRIMLVNNGRGTEFTNYGHPGHAFGQDADPLIAAAGHYGNKSHKLVKHYATDLGYEYLSASNKDEFKESAKRFFTSDKTDSPMLLEVFTDSKDESDALEIMLNLMPVESHGRLQSAVKTGIKEIIGNKGRRIINILREK